MSTPRATAHHRGRNRHLHRACVFSLLVWKVSAVLTITYLGSSTVSIASWAPRKEWKEGRGGEPGIGHLFPPCQPGFSREMEIHFKERAYVVVGSGWACLKSAGQACELETGRNGVHRRNFFSFKETSGLLFTSSADWMTPTHVMETTSFT